MLGKRTSRLGKGGHLAWGVEGSPQALKRDISLDWEGCRLGCGALSGERWGGLVCTEERETSSVLGRRRHRLDWGGACVFYIGEKVVGESLDSYDSEMWVGKSGDFMISIQCMLLVHTFLVFIIIDKVRNILLVVLVPT